MSNYKLYLKFIINFFRKLGKIFKNYFKKDLDYNLYEFFIFKYDLNIKFSKKFKQIFKLNLKEDFNVIKDYYLNLFSPEKWLIDIFI
jgi:hypothetical protein